MERSSSVRGKRKMNAQPSSERTEIRRRNSDRAQFARMTVSTVTPRGRVRRNGDGILVFEHQEPKLSMLWQSTIQPLMVECAATHQAISTEGEVLGGIPHIAGTRLSVGQVLGRLFVHGSISEVVSYYGGQVNAEEIKDVIAYAQDFIEAVCEPPESDGR